VYFSVCEREKLKHCIADVEEIPVQNLTQIEFNFQVLVALVNVLTVTNNHCFLVDVITLTNHLELPVQEESLQYVVLFTSHF
jgi:hypothetical protein